MPRMRTIVARKGEIIHVETPLGIVNIRAGLSDQTGRRVDSVETIPNRYAGERKVTRRGQGNVRLVELKTVKS